MKFLTLLFTLFLIAIPQTGYTQDNQEPNIKIRLLAERGAIAAGEEIWIGIEQSIRPHWHTYWKNPGDSGARPTINWELPPGFEISNINWPTPKKIPYDTLLNYGYENNVILLQKLKAPAEIPETPLTLKAKIDILVCEKECIPEYGEYELTLNGPTAESEDNKAYLDMARTRLPQKVNWKTSYKEKEGTFNITIEPQNKKIFENLNPQTIHIFPEEWGLISNSAQPAVTFENGKIILAQKRGERPIEQIKSAAFVLTLGKGEKQLSYEVTGDLESLFPVKPTKETAAKITEKEPEKTTQPGKTGPSFFQALIFALLGGLILNLMPCVFPVLSLKALSLVKIADKDPAAAKIHGLAYTAGIILSFLAIASTLLILKGAGAEIGWGFQLQSPIVIGALAYLFFFIGLNLFGFFEFGSNLANIGGKLTQGSGYTSSFFTGILATIVATPCTAPFMAVALGFALTQPTLISLLIFASLGLGLALPYLALSFSPKLEKMLPKPGAWMNTFKQFLAFPMFLSAAWLVWVLGQQTGATGILNILIGIILVTFAIWIWKKKNAPIAKLAALLSILAALTLITTLSSQETTSQKHMNEMLSNTQKWEQTWSPEALDKALQTDRPVFVEMTAAWCITCKVNHTTSININATKKLFKDNNVTYLIGDWTNQDKNITKFLNTYGRNGVPIYVYYGPPDETGKRPEEQILPQLLTPGIIAQLFE